MRAMDAGEYEKLSQWWRERPKATSALVAVNRVLTGVGWVAYPLLIVLLALFQPAYLPRMVLVPLAGFLLVTVMRASVDEKRPYEELDIRPLIAKDKRGESFPSRHCFSMTMIALSWLVVCPPAGALLLVASVVMAYVRVVGGVHFPHDVVVGMAIAAAFAVIGFWGLSPLWPAM